jgi:hypothetical protein
MAEKMKLKVDTVDGPNSNGWYEVEFEGGVKASTKDEDVAQEAFKARGTEVEAVIAEVTKGKFTNVYLNSVNGVGGKPATARKSSPRTGGAAPQAGKDNERIARQWANGRAVELFIAGKLPLSKEDAELIASAAADLLAATK